MNAATAALEEALGSAEPQFWYDTPELTQRLNLLLHLLESSPLVLVVEAPAGGGKTTFAAMITAAQGERVKTCRVDAAESGSALAMLQDIGHCCGLEASRDPAAARALLQQYAGRLERAARRGVIVVDNAHNLEPEALRTLLALGCADGEGDAGACWHLVLLREPGPPPPELADRKGQWDVERCHRIELQPWSPGQLETLLEHRLAVIGETLQLGGGRLRAMVEKAGGLPGPLLQEARRVLLPASAHEDRPAPGRRRLPPHAGRWLGGLAVVAVLGAIVLFQDEINRLFRPTPAVRPGTAPAPATPPASPTSPASPASPVAPGPAPQPAPGEGAAPAPAALPGAVPHPAPGSVPEPVPAPTTEAPAGTVPRPMPGGLAGKAEPGTSPAGAGAGPAEAIPSTPPTQAAPAAATPATRAPEPPRGTAGEAAAGNPPAPAEGASPGAEAAATEGQAPPPDWRLRVHLGAGWLLHADPEHRTLQLMGSRKEQTLERLAARHDLADGAAIYEIEYRDGPWYVLVYGEYPDEAAARAALANLPPEVRRLRPWVRSLGQVLAEIRRGRK